MFLDCCVVGQLADEAKRRSWTYVSKEGRYISCRPRSAYKRTRQTNLFYIESVTPSSVRVQEIYGPTELLGWNAVRESPVIVMND